ncbi:putative anthocyanidin 3-O-glucosyltransferase 2 [Iris pallida]|uniref:Glycosyltransferase n=1 Tax=Iris pallida TaxID=29817 RepID=A0AAX6HZ06_IRIPA|nr:putative anthocyanidin 3-O-glucosyltransferase 2 [Iris pallida]
MSKVGLVFVPAWGAGHITSMLEFARRLLLAAATGTRRFSITVLLIKPPSRDFSSTSLSHMRSLSSAGLDVRFHRLPELDPPEHTDGPEDFISLYFQLHKPHVKAAIIASSSPVPISAILIDFFATPLIDVAHELSLPAYVYFSSNSLMLGLILHLPVLDAAAAETPTELDRAGGDYYIEVPGVVRLPWGLMPSPFLDRKSRGYAWFVYHGRRFREAEGIVVNTAAEIEPAYLSALAEGRFVVAEGGGPAMPKVYPVGPVLSLGDGGGDAEGGAGGRECVVWLDKQPEGSVVFLCFGSGGCFGAHQVKEMAAGLERSGHRFLWCVRSMVVDGSNRQIVDANPDEVLPQGFLERTKDRGMVWPSWAPQVEILSHRAVGGFVTHCGWNSCLEGLWFGVPMLAWPLYAEQHLNQVLMVRDLEVAVGLEVDRKGGNFVAAGELERGVRCLMGEEGRRVRAKVGEMRLASRKAVEGQGGSSYMNLKQLAEDLVCLSVAQGAQQ